MWKRVSMRLASTWFKFILKLEEVCAKHYLFGSLYHRLFYRRMIQTEADAARLSCGEKIMHIGCGSFPFTALQLARRGFQVAAVDYSAKAAENARRVVERCGLSDRIEVICARGQDMDVREMDVIWLPLLVEPRALMVQQFWSQLKQGGRIVCRNPRGILQSLYGTVSLKNLLGVEGESVKQLFKKESVIIVKR